MRTRTRFATLAMASLLSLGSLALFALSARAAVHDYAAGSLLVLSYHDIVDDARSHDDRHAVNASELIAHLGWLRGNGFTPVSLAQVIASRNGGALLPAKAVLLTFDDGYRSLYTHVFPLLKLFNYPALVAVVGSWLEAPPGSLVPFEDNKPAPRHRFVDWGELREMVGSGLVEVASHSYALHRGVLGNAQGNTQPAATTRIFDARHARYEDDATYRARIRADLKANSDLVERKLGTRPRAMVWPFGSYSNETIAIARELGMPIGLTLDDGVNAAAQPLDRLRRVLIELSPSAQDFAWSLQNITEEEPRRIVHIALDDLFDPNADERERRLSRVLDRLQRLYVNTVVLTALSVRDDRAISSYFPTRELPVRADLFNRVAWQMITRLRVQVFARLPLRTGALSDGAVAGLYADLAKHAQLSGFYFEPDEQLRSHALMQAALTHRAPLQSVLTLDTQGIGKEASSPTSLAAALKRHHQVVVAVPAREQDSKRIPDAVALAASHPEGFRRVVIELALDATQKDPVAASVELNRMLRQLKRLGALNVGYRTDSPHDDFPRVEMIRGTLSLRARPQ